MDVKGLKRPKKTKKASPEPKVEPKTVSPKAEAPKPVDQPSNNLHRPASGSSKPKQFRLPPEIIMEFEVAAREQGYRRDNEFFLHVWETYKAQRG